MVRETRPWDAAELLETKADIAAYLNAVLEYGEPALLKAAESRRRPQQACPAGRVRRIPSFSATAL